MMALKEKIICIEYYLTLPNQTLSDTSKTDILLYFNEDFSEQNPQLQFLNDLNSQEAIQQKIEFILSQFILKFDSNQESEYNFIHCYLR